jgi:hypothetical protein
VQTAKLFDDEKQEKYDRKVGDKEILPFLWGPQATQGNEISKVRRFQGEGQ